MKPKVLVADDDGSVRRTIARLLTAGSQPCEVLDAADGARTLALAQSEAPDLILLDLGMPGRDGWSVLRELRSDAKTRTIPVILVTGVGDVSARVGGLALGADDYVSKPFAPPELRARVDRLLWRVRQDLSANPLTRLPGNPAIEQEVGRRIREKRPFAFFYADIDRFKPYNDRYGYARGDDVIRETALLLDASLRAGERPGFLGHVGGDDFVLVTDPADAPVIAQQAVRRFDAAVPGFYPADDLARGFIEVADRQGRRRRFPPMTLSMGIVTTERRPLDHYAKVVEIASEMKAYLKEDRCRRLSRFAFDRRSEAA